LVSVAKGGLDLGALEDEIERQAGDEEATEVKTLIDSIKSSLGERVKDVRATRRLTDSPACLVADDHDVSANLARMPQGRRSARAGFQTDPRDKPEASGRAAAQGGGQEVRRLGCRVARSGDSCRGWSARRSGTVREAR